MATPRPRTTIQRRAISALTTRLPLKFAAIAFALVLWAIVSIEEPTEEVVEVQLQPMPTDSGIVVRRPLPRVQALVVGRGRDLFRLAAQPPVIRIPIAAEAPETLTVRLIPELVELPVEITARVREVLPRSVTLLLDVLAERVVPVVSVLAVEVDTMWRLNGPVRIEPESVTISGPRAVIEGLDSVYTRRMIIRLSDTMPQFVPLDTARLGVIVRPVRVSVRGSLTPAARDTLP
ncbi:MAG TPA: hypothetical protein VMM77_04155 [Gemmatimonadaceae bacterium]|nr:hypothetical protein [Gemmatimonadaceae bacterium]